jgi:hypothetical protein
VQNGQSTEDSMTWEERQARRERVVVPAEELDERRRKRDEAKQSAFEGTILEKGTAA